MRAHPTTRYAISEGQKFAADTSLTVVKCTCGILFAIPDTLNEAALRFRGNNGWHISCPLGHTWHYTGKSDAQKIREAREEAERSRAAAQATRDLLHAEERSHSATRGHLTRQRNRVKAGVCPVQGCKRHFQDLERHMGSKHPDYKP